MIFPLPRGLVVGGLTALLLIAATPAFAQWVWKDEAGRTIASDQPPPLDTPKSRIIRSPRARAAPQAPTPDAEVSSHSDAPKTLADRELDSKQRAKDAAEAEKKASDDAARQQAMQDNCRQVRSNVAALQTGGRATRYNEKGEKIYIDDSQRQAEINQQQAQVAQYCNK